jgi:hypothetical protein
MSRFNGQKADDGGAQLRSGRRRMWEMELANEMHSESHVCMSVCLLQSSMLAFEGRKRWCESAMAIRSMYSVPHHCQHQHVDVMTFGAVPGLRHMVAFLSSPNLHVTRAYIVSGQIFV